MKRQTVQRTAPSSDSAVLHNNVLRQSSALSFIPAKLRYISFLLGRIEIASLKRTRIKSIRICKELISKYTGIILQKNALENSTIFIKVSFFLHKPLKKTLKLHILAIEKEVLHELLL